VDVVGEVDTVTAPLLQLCLDSQTRRRDVRELVVDLEQVTVLDAHGVAVLVRAHRRCVRRGVRLLLRCAGRRRVLDPRQLTELAESANTDPVAHARPRHRGRPTATRPRPATAAHADGRGASGCVSRAAAASTATTALPGS